MIGPFGASVVVPVRAGPPPAPSAKQVRGKRWRRTSHGFYVPADTPRTTHQRIAEAAMVVPEGGAITGWAALHWMGGRWFDGTSQGGRVERPVTVVSCRPSLRSQPGIAVSEERLSPRDIVYYDGLPVTSAVRSLCYEMRYAASKAEATVVADMGARSDLASAAELTAYIADHPGWTGIPQAREALTLMHENSWSPMETRLRLLWICEAELPVPLVNCPIFDLDGRHLGTPDLLDLEAALVVEYDGRDHLERAQRLVDLHREGRLRDVDLDCRSVLADEFTARRALVARLQNARRQALAHAGPRRWTVAPPPWWRPLDTVELRRAERARTWRDSPVRKRPEITDRRAVSQGSIPPLSPLPEI